MYVNVQDFLAADVGYRRSFEIAGEKPDMPGLNLTAPIDGEVTISRLDDGVLVNGTIRTGLEHVCDRCLRSFTRPERINFDRVFRDTPEDDELPIEKDSINLAVLIEQELILAQPIKQLDRRDCPGVEAPIDTTPQVAPSYRIGDRARITKG